MKKVLISFVLLIILTAGHDVSANNDCTSYRGTSKIWWDGAELTKGQIGKLSIQKDTSLFKLEGEKKVHSRTLKAGEQYRIYSFKPGLLSVGGGYFVARDAKVTYQTPSKAKLAGADCVHNRFENHGPQIHNTIAMTGATGYAPDGTPLMYVLLQGEPAKLVVMNLKTNAVWDEHFLTADTSAWGLTVDQDQKAWIGGTPSGNLYQYNPAQKSLKKIGKANPGGTSIHDLEIADGVVYGSTSPDGSLFKYTAADGFKHLGQVQTGKSLARSLAWNEAADTLFTGVGAKADLIAWNMKTGKRTSILPEKYKTETSVYDLDEEEGYLFARMETSKKILVFDSESYQFIKELPAGSRGVSPSGDKKALYYTHNYKLQKYDLSSGKTTAISGTLKGTEAVSLDLVNFSTDGKDQRVVGLLGNSGTFFTYHPNWTSPKVEKLNLPMQPIPIYNIGSGIDGKILSNGFVSGKTTEYNPQENVTEEKIKIGQAESMAVLKGTLYMGIYPGALLYKYNGENADHYVKPTPLSSIGNGQDRIVAMTAISSLDTILMGTSPKNGEIGGSISSYHIPSNKLSVRRNVIPGHSVVSITSHGNYAYAGTSIFSNNTSQSSVSAQFFRFPVSNVQGQIEKISLPLVNPRMIHSLTTASNGVIWGLSDGNLFSYNPQNKQTKTLNIVSATSGRFKNGNVVVGSDGMIYGNVEKVIFRVNPSTMEKTIYKGPPASNLIVAPDGKMYFSSGAELWSIR
ncbi:hypothetical protein [Jeotgalibacillus sp. R-1-5s-1]|uniref:hypothetical protein n=1 Tax=Jeotgalibacillus sp. R-1-5s-1 TaxID=2555897 RepID=UPI00106CA357|nr:hypothetical protein [Jeotgalibacillus sp. R-1-5s-1]TFD97095.1 hypothetical protein E2491_10425 [Jeotgalibacillus sp. R-1-5s-1]